MDVSVAVGYGLLTWPSFELSAFGRAGVATFRRETRVDPSAAGSNVQATSAERSFALLLGAELRVAYFFDPASSATRIGLALSAGVDALACGPTFVVHDATSDTYAEVDRAFVVAPRADLWLVVRLPRFWRHRGSP